MVTATLSSSSTTRRLPLAMLGRASNWQGHAESGAASLAAAQFDRPTVCLDDALRDPQTEAGALLVFGRKERFEDMRQMLFGDALASVTNLDVYRVGHQELGVGAMGDPSGDEDGATLRHGLLCVQHQVEQHLLDLVGRRDHVRQTRLQVVLELHPV